MPFLHPNEPLNIATLNGFDGVLLEPLPFRWRGRLLRSRTGATTDGLSGPKFLKCDLQSGNSYFPAVGHDGFYRGDIQESFDEGKTWHQARFERAAADTALFDLCRDNLVPDLEAKAIYEAVHEFGQAAWDADAPLRAEPKP